MKKEKNVLSVWDFPYTKRWYLTHPWLWVRDAARNIRDFWHRGRYGFTYSNAWNFCDWYPRIGAVVLKYLAKHGNAYPGTEEWNSYEVWQEYLEYLAKRLDRCADCQDILFGADRNEYNDAYDDMLHDTRIKRPDGTTYFRELTPEEQNIRMKYLTRAEEIAKADQEYIEDTYLMIGQDLSKLWD